MEINKSNIYNILNSNNIKPTKDFGQNFLVEPTVSEKIVSLLGDCDNDFVLEIGPGLGSLTHFIKKKVDNLDVIEIDSTFVAYLSYQYPDLNIIYNDALKTNIAKYNKIISNLPYNITSELIIYLLTNGLNCKKYVLMCQTEALDHFVSLEGENYGPSSILIHLLGDIRKEFVVKPGSFVPAPKCTSSVFTISVTNLDREEAVFTYKFAKHMFLNRRKTIYNNLSNYLGNKELAKDILVRVNVNPNERPEKISPLKYKELSSFLKK